MNANVILTKHIRKQIAAKGFSEEAVLAAASAPEKITQVLRYPGQTRRIGGGLAVVGQETAEGFVAITVYLDGIRTPLRDDQRNDPAALASKRALR